MAVAVLATRSELDIHHVCVVVCTDDAPIVPNNSILRSTPLKYTLRQRQHMSPCTMAHRHEQAQLYFLPHSLPSANSKEVFGRSKTTDHP